jgi:hypothetical protein
MFEDIEKAAAALHDTKAGWVNRRDGADALGEAAMRAIDALNAHKEERDVDVARAVGKALGRVSAALAGIPAQAVEETYTLEGLVRHCEKPGERTVEPDGEGFVVQVTLRDGRQQRVYVSPLKRKDGVELIRISTPCGAFDEGALKWALAANMKLARSAIAVGSVGGKEQFIVVNSYFASEATPAAIKASVKEIAFYGDWMEKKLTGRDDF